MQSELLHSHQRSAQDVKLSCFTRRWQVASSKQVGKTGEGSRDLTEMAHADAMEGSASKTARAGEDLVVV